MSEASRRPKEEAGHVPAFSFGPGRDVQLISPYMDAPGLPGFQFMKTRR